MCFFFQVEAQSMTNKVSFIVVDEPGSVIKSSSYSPGVCIEQGSRRRLISRLLRVERHRHCHTKQTRVCRIKKKRTAHTYQDFPLCAEMAWPMCLWLLQRLESESGSVTSRSVVVCRCWFIFSRSSGGREPCRACCCGSGGLRQCRAAGGSRSEVEHPPNVKVETADREEDGSCESRQSGATARGETHSRCPTLVVVLICKQVTCSTPDLPPSSVSPPQFLLLFSTSSCGS